MKNDTKGGWRKRFGKWFKLGFDRSFSTGRWRQLTWLCGGLAGVFLLFWAVSWAVGSGLSGRRVVELLVDPGAFTGGEQAGEAWGLNLVVAVVGAVVFTGALISVVVNMLDGRVTAFRQGLVRYGFSDHVLVLGAGDMLTNLLRVFARDEETRKRDIVVLTSRDAEEVRARVMAQLNQKEEGLSVTILFGRRDSAEELASVHAGEAQEIYILGESGETGHDAVNIACWRSVQRLCAEGKREIKCYMMFDYLSSFHVFQFREHEQPTGELELTIINAQEDWAQRVLVSRCREGREIYYPAIDRKGIGPDDRAGVHFVVAGMTRMGYAMATTAAHIAHFPNFRTRGQRTRITFVGADIRQEMNFFRGHYASLFALSRTTYRWWDNEGKEHTETAMPKAEYGDFMDGEWEFVDGGMEEPQVRALMQEWCRKEQEGEEYLTLAICGATQEANVATALYLPTEVYDAGVPVFVYQPQGGELIDSARETKHYRGLYAFGMRTACFGDDWKRRLAMAKRINYLYEHWNEYTRMSQDEEELKALWMKHPFAEQLSNVYAANSIGTKIRTLKMKVEKTDDEYEEGLENATEDKQQAALERKLKRVGFTKAQEEWLAEIEHNRWNMEKLLLGFRALPISERERVEKALQGTEEEKKAMKAETKHMKTVLFLHKDIAPYEALSKESKKYDQSIVEHLMDVVV